MKPLFPHCGGSRPVKVRTYRRRRFGKLEVVSSHCRGLPNR